MAGPGLNPTPPALSAAETERYGRHLRLPEVGAAGQLKLKGASVLLVGLGGLGSPAALYLAAAGIGRLGLLDADVVELSNLQRQVLYGKSDLGRPKALAAAARLRDINAEIELLPRVERLHAGNAEELVAPYDLVLDGSDNAATRYLVNDVCLKLGKLNVWGAVLRFEGQMAVFGQAGGPCYRCLFPEPPPPGLVPSCAEAGVLGVLPGIIGTLQASAAIELVLRGAEGWDKGRFLIYDGHRLAFRELYLPADPDCPACSRPNAIVLRDEPYLCKARTAEEKNMSTPVPAEIDVRTLDSWRREARPHLLLDVRETDEWQTCHIEGAQLMSLRTVPARKDELDVSAVIVVMCHHGGRSAQAVQYLRAQGFAGATNLLGGIDAWSRQIDPAVPRY